MSAKLKSNRPAIESLAQLAARVASNSRISVGGHHFARLPIALLREVAARGTRGLNYFAWAGGLPLELLLEAQAVESIDICFSSLDIFGLAPRFREVAETRRVPIRDWPALAMIQGLRASQQNLPFMPVQLPEGSTMIERCPAVRFHRDTRTGDVIGLVDAQEIDTVLLHATRADRNGNVEIVGAKALDLAIVGAARQVLVTVEEIVPAGALQQNGRQTIITRNLVTAIAEVPGGAYPTSCLPFYVTDYRQIREMLEGRQGELVAALKRPAGSPSAQLRAAAEIRPEQVVAAPFRSPAASGPAGAPSIDEIMAIRIARMLDDESFASAGAVSPLANVAYRLAKATHAPQAMIATFSCGHVDIAPGVMTLSLVEAMDAGSAVAHCGGDDTYSTYYQAGLVTHEIIGAAQVGPRGETNNLELTKPSGGKLRLPGQGGMSDVANMHKNYVVYVTRHSPATLVKAVETVSSARGLASRAERERAGYQPGDTWLVTNLALFRYDEAAGQLVVVETMPGVAKETIVAETGFKVAFAKSCREVAAPDAEMLRVLREEIDPLGLRRLEFVGAKERGALLDEILARDAEGTRRIVEGVQ
ncbi:MAG: CoA-transferase [Devosia sp.]|nr:CoA-transferase [Devosia sp.]